MARAIYIICSESGAIDQETGRVSLFNVFEKISVGTLDEVRKLGVPGSLVLCVTAAWAPEDGDMDEPFEHETALLPPGADNEAVVTKGHFVFKTFVHRFLTRVMDPPIGQSGTLHVEHRIRKVGQDNWLRQTYRIPVELIGTRQPEPANQP